MSRHRNVRSMNYEDEYYDEDDMYGHSVEDNYCISPGTAAQFTFNRERNVALSNFMDEQGGIPEEDEGDDTDEGTPRTQHRSSLDYTRPKLNDIDEAKLNSVLEEVRNVLGEAVPEGVMVDTIMRHNFSVEGSLNELLTQQDAPKPQREPRRDRRNRSQELDDETDDIYCSNFQDNVFSYIPQNSQGVLKFGASASPQSPSFILQKKNISDVLNAPDINKEQQTSNYHSTQYSTDNSVQDNKDKFSQKSGNGQTVPQLEVASERHTDLKQSLSSLINVHGIRNKGTDQAVASSGKTLSDLAKKHCESNLPNVSGNHLNTSTFLSGNAKSNSDKSQPGSSPLSGLAKTHLESATTLSGLVNTKPGSSPLSGLAKAHLENTSPLSMLAKTHAGSSPLSDLAKPDSKPGSAKIQTGSSPLSGLAKAHLENTSSLSGSAKIQTGSSPLSGLAKSHLENTSSLSGSAKIQTGSSLLSGLAKAHLENTSPLSLLAKTHAGSSPLSDLAKPDSKSSPVGMSLSQLAEAHGVKKLSVTKAASDVCTSENKENQDILKPKSGSLLAFKNKCDKDQIMLSLSSLIEKHGQNESVNAKVPSSEINKDVEAQNTLENNKESKEANVETATAKSKGLSLADLAKKRNPAVSNEVKSKGSIETEKKSTVSKESFINKFTDTDVKSTTAREESEKADFQEGQLSLGIQQLEHIKHFLHDPSSIGKALSLKSCGKSLDKKGKKYKMKKFSYRCQLKDLREILHVEMNIVTPFDFSSPSPDDIIKQKQKQAFNRSGK